MTEFAHSRLAANAPTWLHTGSRLIGGLKQSDVRLNRKMLAQLAVADPESFTAVTSAAGR